MTVEEFIAVLENLETVVYKQGDSETIIDVADLAIFHDYIEGDNIELDMLTAKHIDNKIEWPDGSSLLL